jgi:hypothetical protein
MYVHVAVMVATGNTTHYCPYVIMPLRRAVHAMVAETAAMVIIIDVIHTCTYCGIIIRGAGGHRECTE